MVGNKSIINPVYTFLILHILILEKKTFMNIHLVWIIFTLIYLINVLSLEGREEGGFPSGFLIEVLNKEYLCIVKYTRFALLHLLAMGSWKHNSHCQWHQDILSALFLEMSLSMTSRPPFCFIYWDVTVNDFKTFFLIYL